jgi:hypothetical protein
MIKKKIKQKFVKAEKKRSLFFQLKKKKNIGSNQSIYKKKKISDLPCFPVKVLLLIIKCFNGGKNMT